MRFTNFAALTKALGDSQIRKRVPCSRALVFCTLYSLFSFKVIHGT